MEELFAVRFSWTHLFSMALLLLAVFVALRFLDRLLERAAFLGRWQQPAQNTIRYLSLIFEPLALILLLGIFVMINPVFHGLLLILLFLAAFTHLRNYIAGRIIQLDHHLIRGSRLQMQEIEGVVLEMGRLGMQLQTKEGLYHLTYAQLLSRGYTLISGEEIGGFYQLRLSPGEVDGKIRHQQHIQNLLVTTPYLDWSHKPELTPLNDPQQSLEIRVLLREEKHLHDLIALIREWGYDCRLMDV
ncbi:MAG: hypothetical protein R2824_30195 [Saprospiraceae bacterium]